MRRWCKLALLVMLDPFLSLILDDERPERTPGPKPAPLYQGKSR
jgi:hypothetical protein